ncbi:unnamed protein product, partial [Brassica rapa subsp. trilocularis]
CPGRRQSRTRVRIWLICPPRDARLNLDPPSSHSHRRFPPSHLFRRSSAPTEPPRHRTSSTPCLPVGEAASVELRKPPPYPRQDRR